MRKISTVKNTLGGLCVVLSIAFALGGASIALGSPPSVDEYVSQLRQTAQDVGPDSETKAIEAIVSRTDPDDAIAQFNLGTALMRTKLHHWAVPMLTRATQLAPSNALAYANLGSSSQWNDQCRLAIPAFTKALALDPGNVNAWYWNNAAGECSMYVQEFENAILFCERAIALRRNARTEMCLAKVNFSAGQFDTALSNFLRVHSSTTDIYYKDRAQGGALVSLAKLNRLNQAYDLLKINRKVFRNEVELRRLVDSYERGYMASEEWWRH